MTTLSKVVGTSNKYRNEEPAFPVYEHDGKLWHYENGLLRCLLAREGDDWFERNSFFNEAVINIGSIRQIDSCHWYGCVDANGDPVVLSGETEHYRAGISQDEFRRYAFNLCYVQMHNTGFAQLLMVPCKYLQYLLFNSSKERSDHGKSENG